MHAPGCFPMWRAFFVADVQRPGWSGRMASAVAACARHRPLPGKMPEAARMLLRLISSSDISVHMFHVLHHVRDRRGRF